MVRVVIGFVLGIVAVIIGDQMRVPISKQCPGEVVSMVIDKDGSVLCTYMLVPQGIKTTKEKQNAK